VNAEECEQDRRPRDATINCVHLQKCDTLTHAPHRVLIFDDRFISCSDLLFIKQRIIDSLLDLVHSVQFISAAAPQFRCIEILLFSAESYVSVKRFNYPSEVEKQKRDYASIEVRPEYEETGVNS
jgi:hypothetical protein